MTTNNNEQKINDIIVINLFNIQTKAWVVTLSLMTTNKNEQKINDIIVINLRSIQTKAWVV